MSAAGPASHDRRADRSVNRQTDLQTNRQTDHQTTRRTDWQTDRDRSPADRRTERQTDRSPADALADLACRLAPEVLAEAVAEARERARRLVAERLAGEIVTQACASSGRGPRPLAETGSRTGLYAYGVVPADLDASAVTGLGGATSLRTIARGGLALAVSDVDLALLEGLEEDLSETGRLAALAQDHDRALRDLAEGLNVLPLRFGTVFRDPGDVLDVLADPDGELRDLLAAVAGAREWGLRVEAPPAPTARAEPAAATATAQAFSGSATAGTAGGSADTESDTDTGTGAGAGAGTAYLAARRASLRSADRRRADVAGLLHRVDRALAAHAREVTARRGHAPRLFDQAYLVPLQEEDAFLATAEEVVDELAASGLTAEVTGPWPPYSFARVTLGDHSGGGDGDGDG